jgi:SAM-dependent methyltransferase
MKDFCDEADPSVLVLRQWLDDFYTQKKDYKGFVGPQDKPDLWEPITDVVRRRLADKGKCRILEFGAGLAGFGRHIESMRDRVAFEVQDVTPLNEEALRSQADNVHIGNVLEINHEFDVIFSTFVWEHITNPREVLNHLLNILAPGGSLILAAPRYDFPFYVSPSIRHYSRLKQVLIGLRLWGKRVRVLLGGRPDFLIHTDPAVLHVPWYRDADAVHMVSAFDLKRSLPTGYRLRQLRLPVAGMWRRFWEKYLLLFVEIQRKPSQ